MSSRSIKRLVAAGLVAGGLAAGGPALASMGSSSDGAPGQQAPAPGAARSTPGTGVTTCQGSAQHRTIVKGDDTPLSWENGMKVVQQQITTSATQGWETLVVTFSGETYAVDSLAWIQADIEVDGVTVDPSDAGSPNAFKSGASYANASLTRCVRVRPGVHQVRAKLSTVGTGFAWVDDYTLRIDQLD